MIPNTIQSNLITGIVTALVLVLTSRAGAQTEPSKSPFVAGFERFARHGEFDTLTGGQLLLTELSCTACHATQVAHLQPKGGPRLGGAGNRLNHAWVARFLAGPQEAKPGTTMPEVLHGLTKVEKTDAIAALVAFIGTQTRPFPKFKGNGGLAVPNEFWNLGDVEKGRQLFHRIGCVACHAPDSQYETVETKPTPLDQLLEQLDADELKELGLATSARRVDSVPLGNLAEKYERKSLTYFLLDPNSTRPAGRMPNFQLGVVEAADIAAWLLRDQRSQSTGLQASNSPSDVLVRKGQQLFGTLGCSNCHEVKGIPAAPEAKPLADLDLTTQSHCVGAKRQGAPHFTLDVDQIGAIKVALATVTDRPQRLAAAEDAQLRMLKLNCLGCHERNKRGGVGRYRRAYFETYRNVDIGDEGRLPPPLTGVGGKLQPAWFNRVLQGNGSVRPHMRIRMPLFPTELVKSLPALLAQADSAGSQPSEREIFGAQNAKELVEAGRLLLDTGCVQCHPLRGNALPGVVGIDLEGIAGRVHPMWFHDFLLKPGDLKPRTRMPTFFPDGRSQNADILDGDAHRQVAAMWAYLKDPRQRLPTKIEQAHSQNYELIPKDRPILLRTFMEEAGMHAVAVGFPEKVHFAFDAEQVRLAHAWRGRFLDAQGTWYVRFAPPAKPLGVDQVSLPKGVPLALLKDAQTPWPSTAEDAGYRYLGHKLDKKGVPTFLYQFAHFEIEDRIEPANASQLVRRLKIINRDPSNSANSLWLRGHFGKTLKLTGPLSYIDNAGLEVSIKNLDYAGELCQHEGGIEWIVPLSLQPQQTIEVRYKW